MNEAEAKRPVSDAEAMRPVSGAAGKRSASGAASSWVRAGVILRSSAGIAAIERIRGGLVYFTLPGGRVEPGETAEEAAQREAYEELGVVVKLVGLVATVQFRENTQLYYLAEPVSGEFGTGAGEEMDSPADSPAGTYRAVWVPPGQPELKPAPIAAALSAGPDLDQLLATWLTQPPAFTE
ncbi:NUDIX domain-containing protein [Kribbella sp. NPDC006257]|uniref:NUDIX domain-containing protein n=1 Tax=Kribbella sp. NPDC006257 TaxID=3156738 RepID=UPI0033B1C638